MIAWNIIKGATKVSNKYSTIHIVFYVVCAVLNICTI